MKTLLCLLALIALPGCPPVEKTKEPLIPAYPAELQTQRINFRSSLITSIRAKGKVVITYPDKDGKERRDSAEGVLLIRRKFNEWKGGGGETYYEVILFGRVAGQDVFELGENGKTFWMASRIDPKTAHVITKGIASNFTTHDMSDMPIRAGVIPFLLGIAPVQQTLDTYPLVIVNPENVEVVNIGSVFPPASATSAIEYSRRGTGSVGDVIATRLYRRDGVAEGQATLSNFGRVEAPNLAQDNLDRSVRLPHKIVVEYPARKARIELEIDSPGPLSQEGYELNPTLKDAAFIMPDFEKQGLKVNPGKAP